jgi:apolipoprotein N-acyltransferase
MALRSQASISGLCLALLHACSSACSRAPGLATAAGAFCLPALAWATDAASLPFKADANPDSQTLAVSVLFLLVLLAVGLWLVWRGKSWRSTAAAGVRHWLQHRAPAALPAGHDIVVHNRLRLNARITLVSVTWNDQRCLIACSETGATLLSQTAASESAP